jgi:hypothetical protein
MARYRGCRDEQCSALRRCMAAPFPCSAPDMQSEPDALTVPAAMTPSPWTPPPVTDTELRTAGFSPAARNFPRSEAGARWIAAFNGIPFEHMPAAWYYASNGYMHQYAEKLAAAAQAQT